MVNRTTNLRNAYETTLTAEMSSVAGSMTLDDTTALVAPCYLVLEPDNSGQREYVYVSQIDASVATVTERYLTGSAAASGLTHPAGSAVRMSALAQHVEDLNDRVDDIAAQIAGGTDHGGLQGLADDDHTAYLNNARHDLNARHGSGVVDHGGIGGLADDDHTAYLNNARHDVTARHGSGSVDHGDIAGLADDDHTQYHNTGRHAAVDHTGITGVPAAYDPTTLDDILGGFSEVGTLAVKQGTIRYPMVLAGNIQDIRITANTAPTGAAILVDVNKNGVSIFTTQGNRPQIAATQNAGVSGTPDIQGFVAGDYITVDIDQIGSTLAGADLGLAIRYRRV